MPKNEIAIHIVTAVWGNRYINHMINTSIPSLLGGGNLEALSDHSKAKYSIYTTEKDREKLSQHKIFKRLEKKISVQFFCSEITRANEKYHQATFFYEQAIRDAFGENAGIVFITPDAVWSAGTIKRILEISACNYRAILIDGPRVNAKSFMYEWKNKFSPDNSGGITTPSRILSELALKNPHPYESSTTSGVKWLHDVPYFLHWPVPGEGTVSASFCKFPIFFRPDAPAYKFDGSIDHGLINSAIKDPKKIYYSKDTDEFAVASINEIGFSSINFKPVSKNERLLRIAQWAYLEANPQNMISILQLSRRHGETVSEPKWKHFEQIAIGEIRQILGICQIMELVTYLKKNCATKMARMFALALYQSNLHTHLNVENQKTYVIPNDQSWEIMDNSPIDLFFNSDSVDEFSNWVMAHSTNGIHSSKTVEHIPKGARFVQSDIKVGKDLLHLIDKPFVSLPVMSSK